MSAGDWRPRNRPRRGRPQDDTAAPGSRKATPHHHIALSAIAGLLLLAGAAAFLWIWMQPVSVRITATPSDAQLRLDDGRQAKGQLELDGVPPGPHFVTISREGFETRTVMIQAYRLKGCDDSFALEPQPQPVEITAVPEGARIEVVRDERILAEGSGELTAELPAGPLVLKVTHEGRNTYSQQIFLDRPLAKQVRLDPAGQVVQSLSVTECSGAPKAVALTPDGSEAWATILNGPPSIEIFDPRTGKCIDRIDLGKHGAVEIVFNKAGTRAYASQMETARVFEVDVVRRKVLRKLATESAWTKVVALSPDEKTLYAANWSGDDVSEIDLESGGVRRRIRVADTPRGLWPTADGKTLWVASFGTGDLERVNLETGKVEKVFSSGGALRHLVADEQRGKLYASDMAKDCIWVTNMTTGKTKKFADVDHKPNTIELTPNGNVLFVSCRGANNPVSYYLPGPEWGSVLLYDTSDGRPLDAIVGGNQCTALDMSSTNRVLAFSDFLDDRLRFYDVPAYEVLAEADGGRFGVHKNELKKELAFPEQ